MNSSAVLIEKLLLKGVNIPAPNAVVLEDIDCDRILPGCTIYPGTILRGNKTFIGKNAVIGEGGGSLVENTQIGSNCRIMQGTYRNCTLLDNVIVRNGAEIREGSLLEEGAELGHTVGLKQTIFFPDVVAGSLINFCDALITGGTSRKVHSEIGSCLALYNYTPAGDKFASIFGDVEHGVFLNQKPIFVGGQTQIVSPIHVGFGSVIAAGSKIIKNIPENTMIGTADTAFEMPFDKIAIRRPDEKIETTIFYIQQLELLKLWYQNVRLVIFDKSEEFPIYQAAVEQIQSGIDERTKRLEKFAEKLPQSLEFHQSQKHAQEIERHIKALELLKSSRTVQNPWDTSKIAQALKTKLSEGMTYPQAVRSLQNH